MSTNCEIKFVNNPNGVYYSGQTLYGLIKLTTTNQKTIRAIHIEVKGYVKIRWRVSKNSQVNEREDYLSSRTYVVGHENGPSFDFFPGVYTYNFQVQLPEPLPSSLESLRHGHIRYETILTIDRPLRFDNVFTRPFTVIKPLDLNMYPIYKVPIHAELTKEFWCGCCNTLPLKIQAYVPFSGYASGDKIPFTIKINNESNIDCYSSKIEFERIIRFVPQNSSYNPRFEKVNILEKGLAAIPRRSTREFQNFIQLPKIPPSCITATCKQIEVGYQMRVNIYTGVCHVNAKLEFPITIGSIPFNESHMNSANVITEQPTAPRIPSDGDGSLPPYVTNVPPSYADAVATNNKPFVNGDPDEHSKSQASPAENDELPPDKCATTYGWPS